MKSWLSPRCAELVASFKSFSSPRTCVGGSSGPMHLISRPEDQRVQSKAQTGPAFAFKPSRRSFDRVAERNLGQLPLQLTSGCCRSNPHPLFLSPHYALALLSLPPSSGFCSLPSCFPSVLLPHLTWQWKAN